jgi:hypothetical protein
MCVYTGINVLGYSIIHGCALVIEFVLLDQPMTHQFITPLNAASSKHTSVVNKKKCLLIRVKYLD